MIATIHDAIAACAITGQTVVATVDAPARVWEPELVEHVATWAAERGDVQLETTCDEVHAGLTSESVLHAIIREDAELIEYVERGRELGWRSRHVGAMLDEEEQGRRRPFALEVLTAALLPDGEALRISRESARSLAARTWNARNGAKP